jgi:broad specificity phosphatase PhoE
VFLVRHGATENNVADPPLLQGCAVDLGLSAQGRAQAEQAARLLADQTLTAVYSSSLRRALETAEIIAKPHELKVAGIEALKEVDVGRWEGRSWGEIARTEPEAHRRFLEDATQFGYPGGENMTQLLERVEPALRQLMRAHIGERIVVVGHNVVNRVLVAHVLGVPPRHVRRVSHDNCGVSILRIRGEEVRLLTLNSTFHLQ